MTDLDIMSIPRPDKRIDASGVDIGEKPVSDIGGRLASPNQIAHQI